MYDTFRPLIQIQPLFFFRDEWESLAIEEDLYFEALDFSMQPALNESGLFEEYSDWYTRTKRTTSLHGVFIDINPASGDNDILELSRRKCRQSCETALSIGAGNVVFHSSCFPFLRGAYLDAWAARCASFYEELSNEYDLNIFIENSQDIDTIPIKEIMKRINDKRIGVCLDIGHANYTGVPIEQWFDELGDYIGYIHLSDNNGIYDDHLRLGEGNVPFDKADRLWRELNKDTPITIEVGAVDAVRDAVRFLKEHDYFGINRSKKR